MLKFIIKKCYNILASWGSRKKYIYLLICTYTVKFFLQICCALVLVVHNLEDIIFQVPRFSTDLNHPSTMLLFQYTLIQVCFLYRNVDPPIWYDTNVKLFEIQRVWYWSRWQLQQPMKSCVTKIWHSM